MDRHGNLGKRPMAPDSISRVVKKRAQKAGLDPSRYSGHSLRAGFVTPASEQDRELMGELARAIQEQTGESVELAYVDQGYTGERAAAEAEAHGINLEVVKHPEAKRGFVLLPRR